MMCLAVSTLYRRVSDGQTNGIVCAYAGHRAVKKRNIRKVRRGCSHHNRQAIQHRRQPYSVTFHDTLRIIIQSYTNGRHGVDGRQRSPTGLQGLHDYYAIYHDVAHLRCAGTYCRCNRLTTLDVDELDDGAVACGSKWKFVQFAL